MKNKEIDNFKWVRAFSPDVIPKYLVEQVKHKDFSVEDFYKLQENNCLIPSKNGPTLNPLNHLYALANEEKQVKGFLWFVIDPLSKNLVINTFSVDKEYWGQGAIKKVAEFVKEIKNKADLKKVFWITTYPKAYVRQGFKMSKNVIMEYRGD